MRGRRGRGRGGGDEDGGMEHVERVGLGGRLTVEEREGEKRVIWPGGGDWGQQEHSTAGETVHHQNMGHLCHQYMGHTVQMPSLYGTHSTIYAISVWDTQYNK